MHRLKREKSKKKAKKKAKKNVKKKQTILDPVEERTCKKYYRILQVLQVLSEQKRTVLPSPVATPHLPLLIFDNALAIV